MPAASVPVVVVPSLSFTNVTVALVAAAVVFADSSELMLASSAAAPCWDSEEVLVESSVCSAVWSSAWSLGWSCAWLSVWSLAASCEPESSVEAAGCCASPDWSCEDASLDAASAGESSVVGVICSSELCEESSAAGAGAGFAVWPTMA